MSVTAAPQPVLHPELQAVLDCFREARAQPPDTFQHWPGVIGRPSFFDVEALQRHLSNPLLQPSWLSLVFRGQSIPLEQACYYKVVQTKQIVFMDKRVLDGYLAQGASVVLEGLDILDPAINAFIAGLDAGFPLAFANCVAFFSQQGNEAYRGHFDSDDVLVIHISGEKRWRIFARQQWRRVNTHDMTPEQMGPQIGELTMRPGDVLYVRSGVPHICETPGDHSLHLAFDLCDRTPTVEYQLEMALKRYAHATSAPYTPAPQVAGTFAELLKSPAFATDLAQRAEAVRGELRSFRERIAFAGRVTSLSRFAERKRQ
jgi:Cupin superfamily protein